MVIVIATEPRAALVPSKSGFRGRSKNTRLCGTDGRRLRAKWRTRNEVAIPSTDPLTHAGFLDVDRVLPLVDRRANHRFVRTDRHPDAAVGNRAMFPKGVEHLQVTKRCEEGSSPNQKRP